VEFSDNKRCEGITDLYGRKIDYLRVSVTDLCNFRCIYCLPPEGAPQTTHHEILRYEEILRIVDLFVRLGVRKVRVTGGEPLVRRDITHFIQQLTKIEGLKEIALTTNGYLLSRMAVNLKLAGLKRVNISLDSLDPKTFEMITGVDGLQTILEGLQASLDVGFDPVKINVVLLKDINEDDAPEFARMTMDAPIDVRFIERMPFGRNQLVDPPDSFSAEKARLLIEKKLARLRQEAREAGDGPATMFSLPNAKGRIGFIDPITGHFCGTCNRMRLTATGGLRPCLFSNNEIDIKTPLRTGADDMELGAILEKAVASKPVGHGRLDGAAGVGMNRIGG
jgi:cyclic pyranopterin phosphate synthase